MELESLKGLVKRGKIYDLGQPYFPGMPHHPNHPPFAFCLAKKHGDVQYGDGVCAANDLFSMGGHTGTHIDALGHISKNGKVFPGQDVDSLQDYQKGISMVGIDQTPPIFSRGVLLDVASALRKEVLDREDGIGAMELEITQGHQNLDIRENDAVLIRTGWSRYWSQPREYVSFDAGAPGINESGALWLADRKIRITGSDTTAYEKTPAPSLPVHALLLVEKGIQIIEMMNLEDLARDRVYEFLFIVIPLRIIGGTASPVRPVAII
jgi:kynurenine formamidase